ncbi:hypothetical protein CCR75_001233 [Bremia lactucae]|uniref:Histone-lysine N-methyltransferase n=1 Tax=Bremia lactucae TaxID=4779 RepID=A0A976FQA8_BRELC|nr:hypothetical protein CCR75_001233 [Bremia lactucae]
MTNASPGVVTTSTRSLKTAADCKAADPTIKSSDMEATAYASLNNHETYNTNGKRAHYENLIEVAMQKSPRHKRAAWNNDPCVTPVSTMKFVDETGNECCDINDKNGSVNCKRAILNEVIHASKESRCANDNFYRNIQGEQQVDVYDITSEKWLAAQILRKDSEGYIVEFVGWNTKCVVKIDKTSGYRIQPRASKAHEAWIKYERSIGKQQQGDVEKFQAAQVNNGDLKPFKTVNSKLLPSFVQCGLTRSGRIITSRVEIEALKAKPCQRKKKDSISFEKKFPEEDLCGICGEIEDDELSDMILCDGGCLKSYHFSCLGIDSAPGGEEWLCEQCRTNEQLCFACGRNGSINEKGGVFRCGVASCGKFFHQTCIDANRLSRRAGGKSKPSLSTLEGLLESEAFFRCPRHICFVCEQKRKSSDLMYCLKCPEAYHPQCVPPSARYNSVGLLCWKHVGEQLPKIPPYYLSDRSIDTVTVDSSMHLPWIFLPKVDPDASNSEDCHHFRLLKNIIDDVRLQPPTYRKLGRSIYTCKQQKFSLEDAPACICKLRCGDDCINRLSFTECYGPAPTLGMKFNKHTRESNCMLGENCGNRALHQKVYPRFQKFHTVEKGWALRVLEFVKAGQLVIEYVGEVINEEEKERRLLHHTKNSPEDKNMYIMELGKGEYIDARFKGSVSRFINHSCDPNCHLLKWRVKGVNRIGITALKDIEPGSELSYDYQFHTKEAIEWKCHCGSKSCRGTMAPDKIRITCVSPRKKVTKKELIKQRKRALIQEKIQHDRETKSTARRLSLTNYVSMGDRTTTEKMVVRTGPAVRELQWAKKHKLFNMRDAKHGYNFKLRKELRDARTIRHDRINQELYSVSGSSTTVLSRSGSPEDC